MVKYINVKEKHKRKATLNSVLNTITNILMIISLITSALLVIITGDALLTFLAILLNNVRTILRIKDIEISIDYKSKKIKKERGGYYD